MLTSNDEEVTHSPDRSPAVQGSKLAGDWEILEVYLVSNFRILDWKFSFCFQLVASFYYSGFWEH